MFGGHVFQQTVAIPMGTNCAPLLANLFLYQYEADFIQRIFKKNEKKLARSFNFTFRYTDDVLSPNNSRFVQPQVIKFTSCLPMVCGSLWVLTSSTTKTCRHDIHVAEKQPKVALNAINQIKSRFVDSIYPIELQIKDTTDTDRSASYLDLHLEIERGTVQNETLRQKR